LNGAFNFARINTNIVVSNNVVVTNVIVTSWSRVQGVSDEVKLVTVKTNAGGFTNGDLYFGSNTGIGWVSSDGGQSNLNWCILTNSAVTNALLLRGSLCMDQTGVFSNHLIAVTSDANASSAPKGVWRVDAQRNPALLANIDTFHLEGVITLPNDPQKWGPWAGKIITGDESSQPGVMYSIDPNGIVAVIDTSTLIPDGVRTEDFDIIPPNQNLYAGEPGRNLILELSANYFTNYVGDLLITQAGEGTAAKLFVVHWDAGSTNFVTRSISYIKPNGASGQFEHVSFSPIDLPNQ